MLSDDGQVAQAYNLLFRYRVNPLALQVPLLTELQTEDYWKAINSNRLEDVRLGLRDLIQYLDKDKIENVVTSFEDKLDKSGIKERDVIPSYG